MAEDEQIDDWKAPYISYETLTNFIDKKLGGNIVPPRIDRGFLDSYAGSVQPLLLGTLRTIGLIDEGNAVQEELRRAALTPADRKTVLRQWATGFYREQLQLAEQAATAQMLHESFARHKYNGSTLRKAVVFYLALAEDLDLPKSPHFKPPRQNGPTVSATPRKARRGTKAATAPAPVEPPPGATASAGQGERKTINFGQAGTVTIEVNVKWLDLDDETFRGLRQVVNDLAALEAAASQPRADQGDDSG